MTTFPPGPASPAESLSQVMSGNVLRTLWVSNSILAISQLVKTPCHPALGAVWRVRVTAILW